MPTRVGFSRIVIAVTLFVIFLVATFIFILLPFVYKPVPTGYIELTNSGCNLKMFHKTDWHVQANRVGLGKYVGFLWDNTCFIQIENLGATKKETLIINQVSPKDNFEKLVADSRNRVVNLKDKGFIIEPVELTIMGKLYDNFTLDTTQPQQAILGGYFEYEGNSFSVVSYFDSNNPESIKDMTTTIESIKMN